MSHPSFFQHTSEAIRYLTQCLPSRVGIAWGCFDLFHVHHVPFLQMAKSACGQLAIALVTDDQIASIHAKRRPIFSLEERATMLLGTRYVDIAFPLSADISDLLEQVPHLIFNSQGISDEADEVQRLFPTNAEAQTLSGLNEIDITTQALLHILYKLKLPVPFPRFSKLAVSSENRSRKKISNVISEEELPTLLKHLNERQARIVTTNGSFDILHPGHVQYLRHARTLGDVLLVLVNDDHSIRTLKGEERPIFNLLDRMYTLASLACVDYVIPFSGDNPLYLLERIKPWKHAKGGSFEPDRIAQEKQLVESNGGTFHCFELVEGFSSTNALQKIKSLHQGG